MGAGTSGTPGAKGDPGWRGTRGSREERGGHRATGGAGPRSVRPGQAGRPLSPRASPPRHQRHHQPRRVRPRVPRCSRPRPPGSNNEAERRDRGPGLHRRQPRGRRSSVSEAFLFDLLCSFSSPNAQHIPGTSSAAGPPRQNAAARVWEGAPAAGPVAFGGPLPPSLPDQTSLGTARQEKRGWEGNPAGTGSPPEHALNGGRRLCNFGGGAQAPKTRVGLGPGSATK